MSAVDSSTVLTAVARDDVEHERLGPIEPQHVQALEWNRLAHGKRETRHQIAQVRGICHEPRNGGEHGR